VSTVRDVSVPSPGTAPGFLRDCRGPAREVGSEGRSAGVERARQAHQPPLTPVPRGV